MTKPSPIPIDNQREATLNAAVGLLGLAIDPTWRSAILTHMKVTGAAAALILEFPLEDEINPAPVFRP
jgi:hypothetical protein